MPSESWLPMMFIFEADTCCSFHIKKKKKTRLLKVKLMLVGEVWRTACLTHKSAKQCKTPL